VSENSGPSNLSLRYGVKPAKARSVKSFSCNGLVITPISSLPKLPQVIENGFGILLPYLTIVEIIV
jgi:hypothetical protein